MMEQNQVRPLSTIGAGETVRLDHMETGRGLNSRLASMGFISNVEIRVVSNGHPGPFVIIIKDVKVVLGRGVTQKIFVR